MDKDTVLYFYAFASAFEPLIATLLGTRLTLAAVVDSLLILLTTFLHAIPMQKLLELFRHSSSHG